MVTAGVYLLIRLSPLIEYSVTGLLIISWIGGLTALFAGTTAMFQNDLKRVIAYSTCSQLGWKKSANELYKSGKGRVSAFSILLKRSYSDKSNNPSEETFELEIESIIKKIEARRIYKKSEYVEKIKDVTISNQYTIKSKYRNEARKLYIYGIIR